MEGCADGRAQALNLQCAGRDVDDLGLPKGTALELKTLLESLRAPVHTGAGRGGGGGSPAPAPASAPLAPVLVCDAYTSRTYMHVSSSSYGIPPHLQVVHTCTVYTYICICIICVCVYVCLHFIICVCMYVCIHMYVSHTGQG